MPRFYLDIHNGTGYTPDEDGVDAPSQSDAHTIALEGIRDIVASEVRSGNIGLTGRIEVLDSNRLRLIRVDFSDAVKIELPLNKPEAP